MHLISSSPAFFTKWTATNDKQLIRLVSYPHSTLGLKLIGYVGVP